VIDMSGRPDDHVSHVFQSWHTAARLARRRDASRQRSGVPLPRTGY
jgi:hypothetical protein